MKRLFSLLLAISFMLIGIASIHSSHASTEDDVHFTVVFEKEKIPKNANELIIGLGGEIVDTIPEIGVIQVKAPSEFGFEATKDKAIKVASPTLVIENPELETIPMETEKTETTGKMEKNNRGDQQEIDVASASLYEQYQWDIKRMTNNGASFEIETGNHDVVVGIIDSGIDLHHPDVTKNLLPGSKNYVPAGGLYGYDQSETGDINDVQDRNGHGTHVAGNIAGNGQILGIAPHIGFKAYRVFAAEGGAYSSWINKAMIDAANDGVDVISMSLGGIYVKGKVYWTNPDTGETYDYGNDVADYVAYMRAAQYANSKGVLVVAAAGNAALNATNKKEVTEFANELYDDYGYHFVGASFYTPASVPNIVTVSATGPTDELSLYSNYGSGFVDVAGVGGDYRTFLQYSEEDRVDEYIENQLYADEFNLSSVPVVEYEYNDNGTIKDYKYLYPGYSWYIGTSMATPKVSAVAALLKVKYGDVNPYKLKTLVQNTTEDLGKVGYDEHYGHGFVNAYKALQ
ncbi:S8 family serine peptidase [Salirhabdus salicampi]|uniref:S8 family serine peptidase n=1 Tax=Salirhabdus salicampi TaxID=476102 RepID=UPI0020C5403D|nr:S8 family serine peptidase [Salirhabdus salicampi]MCP8616201.1 S8 family serine peptidase [Salirhabdus salicampi]